MEVEHSEGSAEDGAEAVVEALGGSVAGAGDKIVRDLVLPAFAGVAEFVEGRQSQRAGGGQPTRQAGGTGGSSRQGAIIEEFPKEFLNARSMGNPQDAQWWSPHIVKEAAGIPVDAFVQRVLEQPKIWLIGGAD